MEFNTREYRIEEDGHYIIVHDKTRNNLEVCRWLRPCDKVGRAKLISELYRFCYEFY